MTGAPVSALRCVHISKSYPIQKELRVWKILSGVRVVGPAIRALADISLDVPRGKIVGVLGKNGAGKSTLLRVLAGVYQPSSGMIDIHGQVAALFELGGMGNPNLTGREYAQRYLRIMDVRRQDIPVLLDDIQEFSELGDAFENRVRTYSSGMGARLYFAAATALQHEIYLIDELLSVGDEHFQAKCWRRMRQRLLNGASGVLVTHDWAAVLRLCEQAHVIEKGRFTYGGASDKAVVSYLDIPRQPATIARFSADNRRAYAAQSGRDAQFEFEVELLKDASVDFAVSVEMLRIGIGWEIVLLADGLPVSGGVGTHLVTVHIPALPLAPGTYSLNVFLTSRKKSALDATINLDSRTWTIGNGFELEVSGAATNAALRLPFVARRHLVEAQ